MGRTTCGASDDKDRVQETRDRERERRRESSSDRNNFLQSDAFHLLFERSRAGRTKKWKKRKKEKKEKKVEQRDVS